jgi:hypothetical protein
MKAFYICEKKKDVFGDLRKVRKSLKKLKSANLRICDLRNLFANRPPLLNIQVTRIRGENEIDFFYFRYRTLRGVIYFGRK